MANIESAYNNYAKTPSDINEHLPTLKTYAESCEHITELGVRDAISTIGFIQGLVNNNSPAWWELDCPVISTDLKHSHYDANCGCTSNPPCTSVCDPDALFLFSFFQRWKEEGLDFFYLAMEDHAFISFHLLP